MAKQGGGHVHSEKDVLSRREYDKIRHLVAKLKKDFR
jgi:hypothetical protein